MIVIAEDDLPNGPNTPPPDNDVVLEDNDEPLSQSGGDPEFPPQSSDSIEHDGELPTQDFEPFDPGSAYETVSAPTSKYDNENQSLGIPEKVWLSTNENVPLRIIYTTLKGYTTERTVIPDHVHYAKGHAILVAWCQLRNDWRAFIVDRISQAKLEG